MNFIDKTLDAIERTVLVITLGLMLLFISIAVICRVSGIASLTWGEEAARYLMIWLAMIALSAGFKTDSHLGLEFFVNKFKGSAKKAVVIIRASIIIIFCAVIVYQGTLVMMNQYRFVQYSPSLRIPMYFLYGSIPVGYFMSMLRFIMYTIRDVKGMNDEEKKEMML